MKGMSLSLVEFGLLLWPVKLVWAEGRKFVNFLVFLRILSSYEFC